VKEKLPAEQAVTRPERVLPPAVQEALGELVGAAQEGLMALSVGVGLGVLAELMEQEVVEVVGPRGRHDPDRSAVRHGHEAGEATLGGRRVPIDRPRVRAVDGSGEVPLEVYRHFADRDPLSRIVMERMLAGVSCRRYPRTQEPVGAEVEDEARAISKSAISRTFIARTAETLAELMSRRLDDVRLAVLMLDGIELKGRTNVVALGITTDGVKIPLGLWEGSTENATVARALLADLVERGLDTTQGVLCVLDGSKALRRAVRDVLGERTPVQRCIRHKERNVTEHLPERDRAGVRRRLRAAWDDRDHGRALDRLEVLAAELERSPPGRRRLASRGDGRDAHPHPPGDRRAAQAHPRLHEPDRVDDRVRAPLGAQRQALVLGRDGAALDGGRDARGRAPVPQDHRLPAARPAGGGDRAGGHPDRADRGGDYPRHCVATSADRRPKFHGERDILLLERACP
jgi:putative transposase